MDAAGTRYEVRANGDGFLRKRLVKKGSVVPTATPLATIDADGENIPYDRPYSIACRLTNSGRYRKGKPLASRAWRSVKGFLNTRIYLGYSQRAMRQGFIARMVFLAIFLAVGIYVEATIIWWFMLAAVVCGVLIAFAIRRSGL